MAERLWRSTQAVSMRERVDALVRQALGGPFPGE